MPTSYKGERFQLYQLRVTARARELVLERMSAFDPKRTLALVAITSAFDPKPTPPIRLAAHEYVAAGFSRRAQSSSAIRIAPLRGCSARHSCFGEGRDQVGETLRLIERQEVPCLRNRLYLCIWDRRHRATPLVRS